MARPDTWMPFSVALIREGWRTQHTYAPHFAEPPSGAGIYLFAVFPDIAEEPIIAYVGKSFTLSQRLRGHPILTAIRHEAPNAYVQAWFLELGPDDIHDAEIAAIQRFNPPYNLQHRLRGLRHG